LAHCEGGWIEGVLENKDRIVCKKAMLKMEKQNLILEKLKFYFNGSVLHSIKVFSKLLNIRIRQTFLPLHDPIKCFSTRKREFFSKILG